MAKARHVKFCTVVYQVTVRSFVCSFVLSGMAVGCWQSSDVPSATTSAED